MNTGEKLELRVRALSLTSVRLWLGFDGDIAQVSLKRTFNQVYPTVFVQWLSILFKKLTLNRFQSFFKNSELIDLLHYNAIFCILNLWKNCDTEQNDVELWKKNWYSYATYHSEGECMPYRPESLFEGNQIACFGSWFFIQGNKTREPMKNPSSIGNN